MFSSYSEYAMEDSPPECRASAFEGNDLVIVRIPPRHIASNTRNLLIVSILVALAIVALMEGLVMASKKDSIQQQSRGSENGNSTNSSPTYAQGSAYTAQQQESLTTYSNCNDLRADLTLAAKFIAKSKIESDTQRFYHLEEYNTTDCVGCSFQATDFYARYGYYPFSTSHEKAEDRSPIDKDQIVQEGLDDADIVKSDGRYVYAAYGNNIVVWDIANVTIQSRTEMPTMGEDYDYTQGHDFHYYYYDDDDYNYTEDDDGFTDDENGDRRTTRGTHRRTESVDDGFIDDATDDRTTIPGKGGMCISYAQSMVLTDNQLVVIAYCKCFYNDWDEYINDRKLLMDPSSTRVFVFDTTTVPNDQTPLTLLSETTLGGMYASARAINSHVHIVTTSLIDKDTFVQNLDRSNIDLYPEHFSESDYRASATVEAERVIPIFVDALVEELKEVTHDDTCSNIVRLPPLPFSDQGEAIVTPQLDFTGDRVLPALTLITSFNVADNRNLASSQAISTSGIFLASSYSNAYASPERVIVAGQAWNQGTDGEWYEDTIIVAFRLVDGTSSATSIGRVPGHLLMPPVNFYYLTSMDFAHSDGVDYLRVATANCQRWEYDAEWAIWWDLDSDCSNYVTVLAFPDDDDAQDRTMTVVGQLDDLGVPGKVDAVRFIGDRGFVMTSRQADPLYTLDLSDPFHPTLVGEMNIPGYASYMHPIGEGLILAVSHNRIDDEYNRDLGQMIYHDGNLGHSISLLDVTNFSDPQIIQQYVAEDYVSTDMSYMDELYDHRAFRYLNESKVLIVPVKWYNNNTEDTESFDGYIVYDIDPSTGISQRFRIDHRPDWEEDIRSCSTDAYLPPRILALGNDIMTLKGSNVLRHGLNTDEREGVPLDLDTNYPFGYDCGSIQFHFKLSFG